jgi:hypothetical protein
VGQVLNLPHQIIKSRVPANSDNPIHSFQEKEFFAEVRGAPARATSCLSLAREGAPLRRILFPERYRFID